MSPKAQDGSSTSMVTRFKRLTMFDAGSRERCHWPAVIVGGPRLADSKWELHLMTAVPLNGCSPKLCISYYFYHYPTILIPLISLPFHRVLLWWEKSSAILGGVCMSVCLFECMQVCIWGDQASVHNGALLSGHCWRHRLTRRTLIGSAGDNELEVDEVEMNWTWPAVQLHTVTPRAYTPVTFFSYAQALTHKHLHR